MRGKVLFNYVNKVIKNQPPLWHKSYRPITDWFDTSEVCKVRQMDIHTKIRFQLIFFSPT